MIGSSRTKTIGFLTIAVLLSGAIYVTLEGQGVRIRVDEDKSTFYIFNENSRWEVAGREYNRLFRGNTLQYRNVSGITIETREEGDYFIIQRKTPYRNGAMITDAFWFLTNVSEKELFPIAHVVAIENARGLLYRYSLDELEDIGPKRKLQGETFLTFGDNMKLTFPGNYRWAWVGWPYGETDSFAAQYDIPSDYEVLEFRFFDPPKKKPKEKNIQFFQSREFSINRNFWAYKSNGSIINGTIMMSSVPLGVPNGTEQFGNVTISNRVDAVDIEKINGTWAIYTKKDNDTYMEVLEIRKDSVLLKHRISAKEAGKPIPFDGEIKEDFVDMEAGRDYIGWYAKPKDGYLKFGENSTIIKLSIADTENLEDTYISEKNPSTNYGTFNRIWIHATYRLGNYTKAGAIMWNITSPGIIPENQQIDLAYQSFYIMDHNLDAGEGIIVHMHELFQYPTYNISDVAWNETAMVWGNGPTSCSYYNCTAESSLYFEGNATNTLLNATAFYNFTVTVMTQKAYVAGDDNFSIFINATETLGSPADEGLQTPTKEEGGTSFDPIFWIAHSAAVADNAPTNVNPVTPADGITNTTLYEEFNCTAEDDTLLVNISILMNESGSWTENYTRTVTGTWNYSWLNESFPNATTILWGCRACDNSSQCTDSSANRTVHFDDSVVADSCTPPASGIWTIEDACVKTVSVDNCPDGTNITSTGSLNMSGNIYLNTSFIYWAPISGAFSWRLNYQDGASVYWGSC